MTLLFTDIASSSALWDADATSMAAAMIAHDKLLRHYMARHTGYEVKQNGDGFMIAFESAGDALAFCVSLQRHFDDIGKGPRRVSGLGEESDESKTDEEVLSKIRLRMCLHHGEPTLQYNALIQRMDFLGPMVNRCARYIQATDPGQIVVSREFLRALHREGTGRTGEVGNTAEEELEELEAELVGRTRNLTIGLRARSKDEGRRRMKFAVQSMGAREFKGVGGRQILYVIMPTGSEEENVSD
ncbi:uncharacterized protein HMPREF1541_05300 [Cyphellophora europaea CBS 101466]|uniref:Guanylate cyclase domain-containing protein n=1 Tax=Cyphellophora europaea (strain CBS 101466) TaxID=1220924 RepID=W2RTK9_CYPE1|nr:uncharacterized protein HMPREF1541_05300 [Cyphellophora europaea CBS 101466]ETN39078.1 hypothetical protein HMPREF1541_05300 [Cyphellophora europaea CBS 101466]